MNGSHCVLQERRYCCRYAQRHNLLTYSKKGEDAFTLNGFDNYKKAIEKFCAHEKSDLHLESKLKWNSLGIPSIAAQLSTQITKAQKSRSYTNLRPSCRYLIRQGIALRGHTEEEGNLPQLVASSPGYTILQIESLVSIARNICACQCIWAQDPRIYCVTR